MFKKVKGTFCTIAINRKWHDFLNYCIYSLFLESLYINYA